MSRPDAPLVKWVAAKPAVPGAPSPNGSAWFITLALAAAFGAGCLVAKDHGVEEPATPSFGLTALVCPAAPVAATTSNPETE